MEEGVHANVPPPLEFIATLVASVLQVLPPSSDSATVAALVNGGHMMTPTFLIRGEADAMASSHRVVSEVTSESMRYLMRSNATHGSASFANIPGYYVGGKTGT